MMIIDVEDYLNFVGATNHVLVHYGTPRRSGRYPWGSGDNDGGTHDKRNKAFLDHVADLRRQGMSEPEIARGMSMTTTELRAAKSIAKNAQKQADIGMAQRLKDKGYSNVAIGERMGVPESSIRALLAPGVKDKVDILQATASMLKEQVDSKGFIDIGTGVENYVGIARSKLDTSIAVLKEQGYEVHSIQVDQLGTTNKTIVKVLAPPGTTYRDIVTNKGAVRQIDQIESFSEDGGRSYLGIHPPLDVSSKRVAVRYNEEGGSEADGVIYIRPGVKDISIGDSRYAQVRVSVEGTHYLKGMAVYKDDLPDGVDLMFNTNKSNTGNKLDAMKAMKDDPDNPFGATIRQIVERDANGQERVTSAMNIVGHKDGSGEEGSWDTWSRNLPSQFLSKQSPKLAQTQLDMTYESKRKEFDEIMSLTNPTVKRKLLEAYADSTDSSAVHLKAAALPRQSTHVILPIRSMKDNEIYAPNFENGEVVALVRFPHGGTFEIPELVVNNNRREAIKMLGRAKDAVGINHRVAERLSGADFDGDTVLVIPNNSGRVKSKPALEGLKNFDTRTAYPPYDGMKTMDGGTYNAKTRKIEYAPGKKPSSRTKGFEMGDVSNLITDMTIKRATDSELARAVRHSMVVIDAEKHGLNYKQSAQDNGIKALKDKYQSDPSNPDGRGRGASTLISRATARTDIPKRILRAASAGGAIDKETGKKVYTPTGESWLDAKGNVKYRTERSQKLAETDDAFTLSSGTLMEQTYAQHSNKLKALANDARRESLRVTPIPYSPSAKKAYATEVESLNSKLSLAIKNRPLERQAQLLANTTLAAKKAANPDMDHDAIKKVKAQALTEARLRTGANKQRVTLSDSEWAAIQAGAIAPSRLKDILANSDLERVKQLATPRTQLLMTSAKTTRARAMAATGFTQSEIASALGVSLTTLKTTLSEG